MITQVRSRVSAGNGMISIEDCANVIESGGFSLRDAATVRHALSSAGQLSDRNAFAASWDDLPIDAFMADGGRCRRRQCATQPPSAPLARSRRVSSMHPRYLCRRCRMRCLIDTLANERPPKGDLAILQNGDRARPLSHILSQSLKDAPDTSRRQDASDFIDFA